MFNSIKRHDSSEGNVWKYVFEKEDAVTEAVLYKYNDFYDRTVVCCSVQSGCPIGCTFCGTGNKFIRNLTPEEIVYQIQYLFKDMNIEDINERCPKLQIMFMSMGEPMTNWSNVEKAIYKLNEIYPNAQLLISTIGVNNDAIFSKMIKTSKEISKVGLQFSIHQAFDEDRNNLIPFKNKMSLRKIREAGLVWSKETGRSVYLNYCVDGKNVTEAHLSRLKDLFNPMNFNFTFSVVCSADETMKDAGYRNHEKIKEVMDSFAEDGYNVRMFDPAGQDDIGGGCGQLWYVQQWMNTYKNAANK
ncbi:putative dual-specificity RNA methyltransferase RlmN [compost metagenome]